MSEELKPENFLGPLKECVKAYRVMARIGLRPRSYYDEARKKCEAAIRQIQRFKRQSNVR